jgi:hypothetical protein
MTKQEYAIELQKLAEKYEQDKFNLLKQYVDGMHKYKVGDKFIVMDKKEILKLIENPVSFFNDKIKNGLEQQNAMLKMELYSNTRFTSSIKSIKHCDTCIYSGPSQYNNLLECAKIADNSNMSSIVFVPCSGYCKDHRE